MVRFAHSYLLGVLVPLAGGCIIDSIPLPDWGRDDRATDAAGPPGDDSWPDDATGTTEGEAVDATRMYHAPDATGSGVRLVGTPGAVLAAGTVTVYSEVDPTWQNSTDAGDNGAFNLLVQAHAGEWVVIDVHRDGTAYGPVRLQLAEGTVEARGALLAPSAEGVPAASDGDGSDPGQWPEPTAAGIVVFPPVQGTVRVAGGPGTLSAEISVVIANLDSGDAALAAGESNGSFEATLGGASGDSLQLFAVEASASNGGGGTVVLVVP